MVPDPDDSSQGNDLRDAVRTALINKRAGIRFETNATQLGRLGSDLGKREQWNRK
jgi:hypothetical protein